MEVGIEIVLMILLSTIVIASITVGLILFVKKYNQNLVLKEQAHENEMLTVKTDALVEFVHKIESEKYRIAKDLHDEIGPLISILRFKSDRSQFATDEEFDQQLQILDDLATKVKESCLDLAPSILMRFGFEAALAHFTQSSNAAFALTFKGIELLDGLDQPMSYKTNLYRVLSELINNILKHGATDALLLQVEQEKETTKIRMQYVGQGLTNKSFHTSEQNSRGIGLVSIKERLLFLGAQIDFSKKKTDCLITIEL